MINLNFHLDILHFCTEKFNIKQIYYITICRESGLYPQIFRPLCLDFCYYCGTKSESSIVIDKIVYTSSQWRTLTTLNKNGSTNVYTSIFTDSTVEYFVKYSRETNSRAEVCQEVN